MCVHCSTNDALYEDPKLLEQLQENPAYVKATTSAVEGDIEDDDYETCGM